MGNIANLSNSAVLIERGDLEMILRTLTAFQQASSEAAEIILRRLDDIDGDPDISPDGDELDGSGGEDDFSPQGTGLSGPGCPLSDPGEEDDEPEEDDPAGQYDEDCYTVPKVRGYYGPGCMISDPDYEHDGREEEYELTPDYGIDQTKPLPDAMVIASDRANMREHLNRIREEACDKFIRYGKADYRLRGRV